MIFDSPTPILDVHTHHVDAPDSILSVEPRDASGILAKMPGRAISVGLHPWHEHTESDFEALLSLVDHPEVLAIGECGLDALRGLKIDVQASWFERQVELSEQVGKPMIIHCVKAWDRLLEIRRHIRPRQPWIIHGFRGGPQLARQLLDKSLYLSLGEHFNPSTAAIVPTDRLLFETDESSLPITDIVARVLGFRL